MVVDTRRIRFGGLGEEHLVHVQVVCGPRQPVVFAKCAHKDLSNTYSTDEKFRSIYPI